MVSHHNTEFGGHRHCDCGDMISLVLEGQDSTSACLNLPLLFISKAHRMAWQGHMALRNGASDCISSTLSTLVSTGLTGGDVIYLTCHTTSYDHHMEGL